MFFCSLCCTSRTHVWLLCCYRNLCNLLTTQKMKIVTYYLFYIYSVHVNVGPEKNLFVNIEQYISPSEKKMLYLKRKQSQTCVHQANYHRCIITMSYAPCNVALTNICTDKMTRQESSLTLLPFALTLWTVLLIVVSLSVACLMIISILYCLRGTCKNLYTVNKM